MSEKTSGAARACPAPAASERPSAEGLTSAEVAERRARGLVNANADVSTKTVGQILSEHVLTLFNAINLAMAALVATTGQWRNMLFMVVVVANVVIGVYQELRAKVLVDRLTILSSKPVRARRDGCEQEVGVEGLVQDDVVLLSRGDQVPADAVVLEGAASLDESLLTGESDAIGKGPGDELFAGSFLESGSVACRLTRVGAESFAGRVSGEAKYVKPVRSEIRDTIRGIIRMATYALVPLGLALFARSMAKGLGYQQAVLSMVSAVIGMIPQGLVLLTSTVLALATTRLARRKVLVQQSYCVETLARVDVLCLDKTGTITSGRMRVRQASDERAARAAYQVVRANEGDANETARAILAYGEGLGLAFEPVVRSVPFSSRTKLSGCVTRDGRALVLGAAQFVLGHGVEAPAGASALDRVLVVAEVGGFDDQGVPQGEPRLVGTLAVSDELRPSARETVSYFEAQGVALRVISGDDARTVSAVAREAGVDGAERWVDATTLADDEALARAARDYVVFGRVTPVQKRQLVRALRDQGHVVAMTGDGVNDVLALKEADCSVAMASGAAAARNVSEVVLADNDFSHMPEVVAEGRRSINNLERSASLFLVKTVYSAALALVCVLVPPYPFIPIQMSLVSAALIGVPSFVLALEPNHDRVSGNFLAKVLARSLPASLAITCGLVACVLVGRGVGLDYSEVSTACTLVLSAVGLALILRISQPLTPLRLALFVACAAMVALGVVAFPAFFRFSGPSAPMVALVLAAGAGSLVLFWWLFDRAAADLAARGPLSQAIVRWEERYVRDDH